MGSQRVGHNWLTELNWTEVKRNYDDISNSMDMSLSKLWEIDSEGQGRPGMLQSMALQRWTQLSNWTTTTNDLTWLLEELKKESQDAAEDTGSCCPRSNTHTGRPWSEDRWSVWERRICKEIFNALHNKCQELGDGSQKLLFFFHV